MLVLAQSMLGTADVFNLKSMVFNNKFVENTVEP